jgi:hypothetical protein
VFCANSKLSVEDFAFKFAYIGSPWNDLRGSGGDGGLSIRDRRLMVNILHNLRDAHEGTTVPPGAMKLYRDLKVKFKNMEFTPDGIFGVKEETLFLVSLDIFRESLEKFSGRKIVIATKLDTEQFAMNDVRAVVHNTENSNQFPLAAQGTLNSVSDYDRIKYLEFCPEMKLFFPVLHNPGCFGADPDPVKCFAYLCMHGGLKCLKPSNAQFASSKGLNTTIQLTVT